MKKIYNIKLIAFVVCAFLIVTSFSSVATTFSGKVTEIEVVLQNGKNSFIDGKVSKNLIYQFSFDEPELEEVKLYNSTFTKIDIPGSIPIGRVGEPSLPVKSVRVLLPRGTEVTNINVVGEAVEINTSAKGFNLNISPVVPYQAPVRIGMSVPDSIEIDTVVYKSKNLVPGENCEYSGVGDCCGYSILTLHLYPVQYNPGEGRLFYYPYMTVEVGLEETGYVSSFYRASLADKTRVESLVVNPMVTETYGDSAFDAKLYTDGLCDSSDNYDYVIITNEALNNTVGQPYNWDDLLDHRSMYSGLTGTKITVEMIDSCPGYWNGTVFFNDSAAHIREFIKDAYQNWGVQYVLLGGDWDENNPGKQVVPARIFTASQSADKYDEMPCDLYYSNLNGTWWNGDAWGGGQNSSANDPFAEVYVGRLTVDNATQLSNVLQKIIWYDLHEDFDFFRKAVFFGGNLGWPITSKDYMEEIRNGTDPNFYQCKGFKEWNEENKPEYQFDISERRYYNWGDSIPADYKTLINNDAAGIINHLSHGNEIFALDMDTSELKSLTNSKYFFAYSQGCLCGRFTYGDSTEKTLTCYSSENGAFAVVLNTGYGWGHGYCTNGSSQFLQRQFWNYMFNVTDIDNWMMGAAQAYSKDKLSAYINNDNWHYSWAYVFYSAHLFGDPAQAIRPPLIPEHNVGVQTLDVPSHIKANQMIYVNTTIFNHGQNNETDVLVRLLANGSPVDDITIPFFEWWTTADVSFTWTPSTAGVYTVTINVTIPGITDDFYSDNEKSKLVRIGVLNSDTGECFNTIQEAVDDPDTLNGHNIIVPIGVYQENVLVDKGVSLIGINKETTTIEGADPGDSVIHVHGTNFVNITDFTIKSETYGVYIESSSNISIRENIVSDNSGAGVYLELSHNVVITNNEIFDNSWGVRVTAGSNNNLIYHNSFNNTHNAFDEVGGNQWDNGYGSFFLCGGNLWSDYDGSDEKSGPGQDEPGSDGFGDTPYDISGGSSQDRYPLMYPFDLRIINLHTGEVFLSIQDALDDNDTLDGHTIIVRGGTYYENVVIDKTVNLVGEDRDNTIIDGGRILNNGVYITADWVNISGFTVQNYGYCFSYGGIHVQSDYNTISDNNIINSYDYIDYKYGILLKFSSNNTIINCNTYDNDYGIYLYHLSNNNTIINCSSYNYGYGFRFSSSSNNTIINCSSYNYVGLLFGSSSNNTIINNALDCIWLVSSSNNNIVSGNTISDSIWGDGIRLRDSSDNNVSSNTITNNNRYGIFLGGASTNTIYGNTIANTKNGIGLWESSENNINKNTITHSSLYSISLENSSYNVISRNTVTENNYGVVLDLRSSGNMIYHNNFVNNTKNAYDFCTNSWDNGYPSGGNYWSDSDDPNEGALDDYHGLNQDLPGGDGVVDRPYNIRGGNNQDRYPLISPWNDAEPTSPYGNVNVDEKISVMYLFDKPVLEKARAGDTAYNQVIMKDLSSWGNVNEPCLPAKGVNLLLPQKTKVSEITVTTGKKIYLGAGFNIVPAEPPVPLPQINSPPPFVPDEEIYNLEGMFPGKLFTEVGTYGFRGYNILVLILHPVQYIPATGDLFYYPDMRVSVELVEDNSINPLFRGLANDRSEVMKKVDNPTVSDNYIEKPVCSKEGGGSPDSYDLLIITTDELKDAFLPLKNAHENDSVNTVIKTLTDIGGSNPEAIRDYIRDAYTSWGIEYVLIGGDDDVIPAKDLYVEAWPGGYVEYEMPSDLYYGCLDGTYNYDGDNKWGEPNDGPDGGDVDLIAEVYVGRACVGNTAEVEHFVDKTIAYMQIDAADDYLREVCLAGEYLGFGKIANYGGNFLDELINGSIVHGYLTVGISSGEYNITTLYDRDWPGFDYHYPETTGWPESEIINRINNNVHLINHLGHGDIDNAMKMNSLEADFLANDKYFFVYSQACFAGYFDYEHTGGPPFPIDTDCFAEHLSVKTSHGAFAVIMNARYGWGIRKSTDGPSQRFNREFWDAVFDENMRVISRANQDSKEDNLYRVNNPCMRWCYYELNLFGDPTLAFAHNNSGPPNTPIKPSGMETGGPSIEYSYMTNTTDSDEDQVYYQWDWDDGSFSGWLGPFASGVTCTAPHVWMESGVYNVSVRAKDCWDYISNWSESLTVHINLPPEFSDANPYNGQINIPITISELSITIKDPEGDRFNWTIETNPDIGTNSTTNDNNGTKTCPITPPELEYDTTYTWTVNATDTQSGYTTQTTYTFTTEPFINQPPNKPTITTGPTQGKTNTKYTYTATTTDPDNDNISYLFDWDDETNSGWIGPIENGETATANHTWTKGGTYNIKVKAKDTHNAESSWSETYLVNISGPHLEIVSIDGGIGVTAVIKNKGNEDATDVEWSIKFKGGTIIYPPEGVKEGKVTIPTGQERTVKSGLVLGFGGFLIPIKITVTVGHAEEVVGGKVIIFFVKI